MDEEYLRDVVTPDASSSDDEGYQKKYREILDSKKKVYHTHFALNT